MYNGKYKNNKRLLRWNRQFVLLASIAVLLIGAVGGSLAYLFTSTSDVVNTFQPGEVPPSITENFNSVVKSDVKVQNKGNVDAYIRAVIVVTWQDAAGNVYSKAPVLNEDYEMSINTEDWQLIGGYYYHKGEVATGEFTKVLIKSATANDTEPEGYTLHVEILAQTIQADGVTGGKPVVENIWGEAAASAVGA